jgi:starvation-inducible DNA-binding protein
MSRSELNSFVNRLLAMAVEAKYYHWNIQGSSFFFMHEKLDELHSDLNSYADLLAERIRAANSINFVEVDVAVQIRPMRFNQSDVVHNVMIDLNDLTVDLKTAIVDESDPATQDVLVEIQRGIDKWLWMFTSSR